MHVTGMAGFFTAQFLIGYHAIFNVSWLGWDLVEPLTYSVGQASFILGLFFIMRNRGAGVEYSELQDNYMEKKQRYWQEKYKFDLKRYNFLVRKLELIEKKLALAEHQRFK